jgi:hypothetical protein
VLPLVCSGYKYRRQSLPLTWVIDAQLARMAMDDECGQRAPCDAMGREAW